MLALGVTSVLLTIHILDIYFKSEEEEITGCLRVFVKFSSRVYCRNGARCCKKGDTSVSTFAVTEKEGGMDIQHIDKENIEETLTWQEVAKRMDEFLFSLYIALFIICTAILLIMFIIGFSM
jgi:hypothetical protein